MLEKEQLISSEQLFSGYVIRLRRDTVRCQNGNVATREVVEHPGGVAVVALNDHQEVCMVRQYRRPHDDMIWEIPAGKLEWGEDHFACAVRELEEETGLKAGKFTYLGEYYPTPGFCDEKIHIYLAQELSSGHAHPDENEFLEMKMAGLDELIGLVKENKIKDAKTVIGLLQARLHLELG